MRSIRIEKPTTVGSQIFYEFESGYRSLRDNLSTTFERKCFNIRLEVHRRALPNKQKAPDYRCRQENPQNAANYIHPKVTDSPAIITRQPTNECNTNCKTRSAGYETLRCQTHHLAEVAQRIFASVCLPGSCC